MRNRKKYKQDRDRLNRLENESITMKAFLARILGVGDNGLLSDRITHDDLKAMMPNLVRTSFSFVIDNPEVIINGEVFLVTDSKGKTIPYVNPKILADRAEFYGDYSQQRRKEPIPNIKDIDLPSLSIYELRQLLAIYSKHGIYSAYRKVHEELSSRKDSHCAAKESLGRVLRKERKNERFEY